MITAESKEGYRNCPTLRLRVFRETMRASLPPDFLSTALIRDDRLRHSSSVEDANLTWSNKR